MPNISQSQFIDIVGKITQGLCSNPANGQLYGNSYDLQMCIQNATQALNSAGIYGTETHEGLTAEIQQELINHVSALTRKTVRETLHNEIETQLATMVKQTLANAKKNNI